MYKILGDLIKSPIAIIAMIVVAVVLLFSLGSAIDSVKTTLGFETKENVKEKLTDTTKELEKAVEVNEKNQKDKELNIAIDTATKIVDDNHNEKEKAILKEDKEIQSLLDKEDEELLPIVSSNHDTTSIKVVKEDSPLSKRQIDNLNILINRSHTLKGATE